MKRQIFAPEHDAFRETVRTFLAKEVLPHYEQWEKDGIVSRDAWLAAGKQGLLGLAVQEEHGGGDNADHYRTLARFSTHQDGREGRSCRSAPEGCGVIAKVALSDNEVVGPTAGRAGSNACGGPCKTSSRKGEGKGLRSRNPGWRRIAVRTGIACVTQARASKRRTRRGVHPRGGLGARARAAQRHSGAQEDLLGELNGAFVHLMTNLAQERLNIAVAGIAAAEYLLEITTEYVKEREAFGRPLSRLQHIRFEIAEMATECAVTRTFVDRCTEDHTNGELDAVHASMAKWWATELQKRVADRCLQLHGGYGYMTEYRVARAFTDGRIQTIYGGTTEIMKEIIGRSLLA